MRRASHGLVPAVFLRSHCCGRFYAAPPDLRAKAELIPEASSSVPQGSLRQGTEVASRTRTFFHSGRWRCSGLIESGALGKVSRRAGGIAPPSWNHVTPSDADGWRRCKTRGRPRGHGRISAGPRLARTRSKVCRTSQRLRPPSRLHSTPATPKALRYVQAPIQVPGNRCPFP